jgi:hypothetical protein
MFRLNEKSAMDPKREREALRVERGKVRLSPRDIALARARGRDVPIPSRDKAYFISDREKKAIAYFYEVLKIRGDVIAEAFGVSSRTVYLAGKAYREAKCPKS